METATLWWYEIDREQYGPVSEQEITQLLDNGSLKKENLVWKDGFENWMPIRSTEFNEKVANGANPQTILEQEKSKWYNNNNKLSLSMLFWPAFIYGMYKTNLVKRKTKQIVVTICSFIVIVGFWHEATTPRTICGHYQIPREASYLYPNGGYWPGNDLYIGSILDEKCDDEGAIRQVNTLMRRTEERVGRYRYDRDNDILYLNFNDGGGPTSVHINKDGKLEWGDGYVMTNAFQE